MTIHLVKLCVGADNIDDLRLWQNDEARHRGRPVCDTRHAPKRVEEVLAGGSLYWVIRGVIVVRQRVTAIDVVDDPVTRTRCEISLDPALVLTSPQPRRAFQGWRYLTPEDAPADLTEAGEMADVLPETIRKELITLGIW